jgi:hypothetical protein
LKFTEIVHGGNPFLCSVDISSVWGEKTVGERNPAFRKSRVSSHFES